MLILLWMFGKICLWWYPAQGFVCARNFLITASISLFVSVCWGFLHLLDFVLEGCMFLDIYPFHSGCPISWHIVVRRNFLQSFVFVFLWYQFLLLFHFWFYLFGFSFFLMNLVKSCQFCLLFQGNSSWIYWSF